MAPTDPAPDPTPLARVLPAAAMLAIHAAALALLTRMPPGRDADLWGGYHMAAALIEVVTLSLGLRRSAAAGRTLAVLWAAPAADLVLTAILTFVLRPF